MSLKQTLSVLIFMFSTPVMADSLQECKTAIDQRYQSIPRAEIDLGRKVSVELLTSFWSGTYGLAIQVDGAPYLTFEKSGRNLLPVAFGFGGGFDEVARLMNVTIAAAAVLQAGVTIDPQALLPYVNGFGSCSIAGESLAALIAVRVENSDQGPGQQEQIPGQQEQRPADGDRSPVQGEEERGSGMPLSPDGDRS